MCNGLPDFNNKLFWDEALSYYADSNAQPYADNDGMIVQKMDGVIQLESLFYMLLTINILLSQKYVLLFVTI